MTTLTSSTVVSVAAQTIVTESAEIVVVPIASGPGDAPWRGKGRLVHPNLGTIDYPYAPDEWENVDSDVIIPPVWSGAETLTSAVNALAAGHIRDVLVAEHWTSDASVPIEFLRTLIAFWCAPPAPEDGYVLWYPNYTNPFGYKVIVLGVECGDGGGLSQANFQGSGRDGKIALDFIARQGWVSGRTSLKMRIAGRV